MIRDNIFKQCDNYRDMALVLFKAIRDDMYIPNEIIYNLLEQIADDLNKELIDINDERARLFMNIYKPYKEEK